MLNFVRQCWTLGQMDQFTNTDGRLRSLNHVNFCCPEIVSVAVNIFPVCSNLKCN